jgi:hypothetical protein
MSSLKIILGIDLNTLLASTLVTRAHLKIKVRWSMKILPPVVWAFRFGNETIIQVRTHDRAAQKTKIHEEIVFLGQNWLLKNSRIKEISI